MKHILTGKAVAGLLGGLILVSGVTIGMMHMGNTQESGRTEVQSSQSYLLPKEAASTQAVEVALTETAAVHTGTETATKDKKSTAAALMEQKTEEAKSPDAVTEENRETDTGKETEAAEATEEVTTAKNAEVQPTTAEEKTTKEGTTAAPTTEDAAAKAAAEEAARQQAAAEEAARQQAAAEEAARQQAAAEEAARQQAAAEEAARQAAAQPHALPAGESTNCYNADQIATLKNTLLARINDLRAGSGVGALASNGILNSCAIIRAQEAASSFSHTRPNGGRGLDIMLECGGNYANLSKGENLAYSYDYMTGCDPVMIADEMFNNFCNSASHRANMVSGSYTQIGLGVHVVVEDGFYRVTLATMFSN